MNGLQRIFLRITPIIMLICFVCFGITHAFQQENQPNITYLTHEVITIDDRNTITTEDDITIDNYSFDFKSYRENINVDILKRATNNIIDIQKYNDNLDKFNAIWANGYQIGDGIQTIVNALLLIINTLLISINVILAPIRIISGLILTALSIMAININRETPIINTLNTFLDSLAIPLINTTKETTNNNNDKLYNSTWTFKDNVTTINRYELNAVFTSGGNVYNKLVIQNDPEFGPYHNKAMITYYRSADYGGPDSITVYREGLGWTNYESYKQITFANNNFTDEQCNTIATNLSIYATSTNYANTATTWQWNETLNNINSYTYNVTFTSNEDVFTSIIFEGAANVIYKNEQRQVYVYLTYGGISQWTESEYRTIQITDTSNLNENELTMFNIILNSNASQITE